MNSVQNNMMFIELNLFRIKSHCTYNPVVARTEDFSIFQVEILDQRLKDLYKGDHVLEIWTRQGERIFQQVMQSEITKWRVHDGVFIYRCSADSKLIYVIFLKEKKMASVNISIDNFVSKYNFISMVCVDGDLIYHNGCIIIS